MHILRISVSVLAAISVSLMVLLGVLDASKKEPPVLTCTEENTISVPTNASDKELLKFVSASDDKDGDISDRIVVERQMYFLEKGLTSVVFSVCDSDNNTAKLQRNIRFTDYASPQIRLHNDLIVPLKSTVTIKGLVTVNDKYDGDISNKIKIISPNYNNLVAGEYDINFKATNSFSDTCDVTIKAIVTDEDYSDADIKLSEYLIYTKKGEKVDFESYITNVVDHARGGYNKSQINVDDSEFNAEKEGVYNIFYSIKSGSRTVTKTRLIAVVKGE